MSIELRWTRADEREQLAAARAQLAHHRAANRVMAELLREEDWHRSEVFAFLVFGDAPGRMFGTLRLARKHQGLELPSLIAESIKRSVVVVQVRALRPSHARAAIDRALDESGFSFRCVRLNSGWYPPTRE